MPGDLTNIIYLKKCLQKAGLKPRRQRGQNFLICPEVVAATLTALAANPRQVTELGAGAGALTIPLLWAGYRVKAIEQDQALINILARETKRWSAANFELVADDLRHVNWDWSQDKLPFQLVGNIPYNLSGYIIRHLVQLRPAPVQSLLLVQREVGQRLMASPPNMSLISLAVKLWGEANILLRVPATCFWPVPRVNSCLVLLTPRELNNQGVAEQEQVLQFARAFFQTKRKQMANILKQKLNLDSQVEAIALLNRVDIKPTSRPAELTADQWRRLACVL